MILWNPISLAGSLNTLFSSGIRNIKLMTFLIRLIVYCKITHGINIMLLKCCLSTRQTKPHTPLEAPLLTDVYWNVSETWANIYHCKILFTHHPIYLYMCVYVNILLTESWMVQPCSHLWLGKLSFIHFSHENGNHGTTQSLEHNWKGNETSQIIFSLSSKADVSWSQEHVG